MYILLGNCTYIEYLPRFHRGRTNVHLVLTSRCCKVKVQTDVGFGTRVERLIAPHTGVYQQRLTSS